MTASFVAQPGDFDFLVGRWHVANRRLRRRLVDADDWDEFDAEYEGLVHLDGALSVDEIRFVDQGWSACTVRTLDRARGCWSIYWITSKAGSIGEPVHGGWNGDDGEFCGVDVDDGRAVEVRFRWRRLSPQSAHWEQAFRLDAGSPWETNWTMDFVRVAAERPS